MPKKKKAVYAAVFLDKESSESLKGFAIHPNIQCHHMTIAFKPSDSLVEELPIGEVVDLEIIGFGQSDKAQAALVVALHPVMRECTNKLPHITISTAEGVSPVESNKLNFDLMDSGLTVSGRVGIFVGNSVQYDLAGTKYK